MVRSLIGAQLTGSGLVVLEHWRMRLLLLRMKSREGVRTDVDLGAAAL